MGFGLTSGISKQTNHSVELAKKVGPDGTVQELKTHGGMQEVTEEFYDDGAFDNEALNGQTGTSSAGVCSAHNLNEVNQDYAKVTKTTQTPLAAPA